LWCFGKVAAMWADASEAEGGKGEVEEGGERWEEMELWCCGGMWKGPTALGMGGVGVEG
jgi:hypothetical protein